MAPYSSIERENGEIWWNTVKMSNVATFLQKLNADITECMILQCNGSQIFKNVVLYVVKMLKIIENLVILSESKVV